MNSDRGALPGRAPVAFPAPRPLPPASRSDSPGKGEGGFIIILTLLIIFTLTLLGVTAFMNAAIEMKISNNENLANQALYAADMGLQHALTLINTDPALKAEINDPRNWTPSWRYPSSDYVKEEQFARNGITYQWYLRFKRDSDDFNHNRDTDEIVFFNKRFGYLNARFNTGEGFPVVEIISEGFTLAAGRNESGAIAGGGILSSRKLALEVGRNRYIPAVQGAITARGSIRLQEKATVDGRAHNTDGELCSVYPAPPCICTAAKPGAFMDWGMKASTDGTGRFIGSPPTKENSGFGTSGRSILPVTPWDALGIPQAEMPPPVTYEQAVDKLANPVMAGEIVSIPYDYNGGGRGILVVHNPLFDPLTAECSQAGLTYDLLHPSNPRNADCFQPDRLTRKHYDSKLDTGNPLYDPHYAETLQPAVFFLTGDSVFTGVLIADAVIMHGTSRINGAVITLGTLTVDLSYSAPEVRYSCDAVNEATSMGYTTKVGWHRM
jgi:hypothetical protein